MRILKFYVNKKLIGLWSSILLGLFLLLGSHFSSTAYAECGPVGCRDHPYNFVLCYDSQCNLAPCDTSTHLYAYSNSPLSCQDGFGGEESVSYNAGYASVHAAGASTFCKGVQMYTSFACLTPPGNPGYCNNGPPYFIYYCAANGIPQPPSCNTGAICDAMCSAPANTCSLNNGTQNCTYYSHTAGIACTPNSFTQPCTTNTCNAGSQCINGICINATPPPPVCGSGCNTNADCSQAGQCSACRPNGAGQNTCQVPPTPTPPPQGVGWFQVNGNVLSLANPPGSQFSIVDTVPAGNFLETAANAITAAFNLITTSAPPAHDLSRVSSATPAQVVENYANFNNSATSGLGKYTYTYFKSRATSTSGSQADIGPYANAAPNTSGIYGTAGNFTVAGAWTIPSSVHVIVFVDGNLNIGSNITVAKGGYLAFYVGGNINITPTTTNVDGMYFSNGTLCTSCDANGTKMP